jgi:hypothetical protein
MGLTEYFRKTGYQAQYHLGDRVSGRYQGVLFVGTVGNDRLVSPERGPEVIVHLDLPLKLNNVTLNSVLVKHQDIKPLKRFDQ